MKGAYLRLLPLLKPILVMVLGAAGSLAAAQFPAYYDAFCRGLGQ